MILTLPLTKAREQLARLVKKSHTKLDEFIITVNGMPSTVLIPFSQYESWKETDEIMSDPQLMKDIKKGEKEIREGKGQSWEEVKKELSWDV